MKIDNVTARPTLDAQDGINQWGKTSSEGIIGSEARTHLGKGPIMLSKQLIVAIKQNLNSICKSKVKWQEN